MSWKKGLYTTLFAASLMVTPQQMLLADPTQANVDTLTQVYTLLVNDHYSHPNEDDLLQGAIEGMLSEINDPFTSYLTPDQYNQFTSAMNQSFAGIGVTLTESEDGKSIVITDVNPGGPADKSGLKAGDRIIQVNKLQTSGTKLSTVVGQIQGQVGTQVIIEIMHSDNKTQTYTITRENIELPEVLSQNLGNDIGYLRIMSFGNRTTDEFKQKLQALESKGAKGLVLDLRGNGGGLVQSALEIADSLLTKGTILIVHDEKGQAQAITADSEGTDIPLVVLVDRNTASASEMLAGALQKNGRAKLIGERTYGKGTMQIPHQLPNGGFLKVSVDQWDTPDGTTPDHVGLKPDIHLTSPESILNAAMQQLLPDRQQELILTRDKTIGSLNGNVLYDTPPLQEQDGHVYLPLRYTIESLGAEVDWLADSQSVQFILDGHQVELDFEHHFLKIDGNTSSVPNSFRVFDGSTYISTDALQVITGHKIDVSDQSIKIYAN